MIKKLVLSGGSYNGLYTIGVLKKLMMNKFFKIKDIDEIYATSVGSIIAIILCLDIDIEDVINYFIERPWDKAYQFTPDMLLNMLSEKGIVNKKFIDIILEKLLLTSDFNINSTLKDLYDITKKNLFIYAIKLDRFECIGFNHESHPNLKILEAVYMSCSIPFVFQPMYYKDSYYVDGGLVLNFPLSCCLENTENTDEILGLHLKSKISINQHRINKHSNIFQYGHYIFESLINYANSILYKNKESIKYYFCINCESATNFEEALTLLKNKEERKNIFKEVMNMGKIL